MGLDAASEALSTARWAIAGGLIVFALFGATGWVFIRNGIADLRGIGNRQEQERARATGVIVDLIRHEKAVRVGRRGRRHTEIVVTWTPVVEFAVEGKVRRLECPDRFAGGQYAVGDALDLLYDADDPADFHFESVVLRERRFGKFSILIGVGLFVAAILIAHHFFAEYGVYSHLGELFPF